MEYSASLTLFVQAHMHVRVLGGERGERGRELKESKYAGWAWISLSWIKAFA
jgi:hypothetical protein